MRYMVIVALMLILQACASQSAVVRKSATVRLGMSEAELRQVMGEPQNRQFKGKNEAWQYCSTDYSGFEDDHYVRVWLFDGVVSGMQTYRNTKFGNCENFFQTVNWQEAPDISN